MAIEIILPALDISQWMGGFLFIIMSIVFGSFAFIFLKEHESAGDVIIGIIFAFITFLLVFALLNVWEIVKLVFV